jgi:NAD(P)-dependent dehydrogenase (short-subunit alcohol dehydrogenase family)
MKTAVVTGAGRGLGRLIAQGLAEKGFAVLATDIDEEAARQTAESIGGNAWSARHDVRDADSHHRLAREANDRGALALWVNNAGVLRSANAWEHTEEDVRLQVDVNVLGVIFGCQAAIQFMRNTGGHIINIASISSLTPAPGVAVYGATKHAVLGFTTSLQGDLMRAGYDIKVSALCPDAIDTNMVRDVQHESHAALLFSAGKLLKAEDVAATALDLVDKPKLVKVTPSGRGFLAHVPSFGLKVLQQFWKIGDRNRQRG